MQYQLPVVAFMLMVMGIRGGCVISDLNEQDFSCSAARTKKVLLNFHPHKLFPSPKFQTYRKLHSGPPAVPLA